MDFDFWYLAAVPILFAAGWWLRGVDEKQRSKEKTGLDDKYFRGLSLLLSDEPDKAIDLFIKVVEVDPETIELHHALGNLFRRRGEFERAIRIHTYLANRAELPEQERQQALSEVALDFLKAGMYDRAESAYELLAKCPERRLEAAHALVRIYCTEKEWLKAVGEAELLEKHGEDHHVEIAHFCCELAENARRMKDLERAQQFADRAIKTNAASPRALALQADLALDRGDQKAAFVFWHEIEEKEPTYMPLIAGKMADVMAETDQHKAVEFLKGIFAKTGSVDVLRATVERLAAWQGVPQAGEFAAQALKASPTLSAFAVAMDMSARAHPEDAQAAMLAKLLANQARNVSRYQCRKCGYLSHSFAWRCPGCETWDAFPPLRAEEVRRKPTAPAAKKA